MEDKKYKEKGKGVIMEPESSGMQQLTALVVDDDKSARVIHQVMLNRAGVRTQAVGNGKEAVDIHIRGQSFDLILMDKDMPFMNGLEATKMLRSIGIRGMIIGLSSCPIPQIEEFMNAGLDDFYMKPLTVDMVTAILDRVKKS